VAALVTYAAIKAVQRAVPDEIDAGAETDISRD
jgi:hypothetical protein